MTYQSGWLAAETTAALYGPNSQIGLIWNRPAEQRDHREDDHEEAAGLDRERREHPDADHVVVGPAGAGPLRVLLLDQQAHVHA